MKKYSFILFFICAFSLVPLNSFALTESEIAAQEAQWRSELAATEKEIAQWESVLNQTKQGTASLQRDAAVLQAKISEAKAFIKKRQIQIEQLTRDIGLKTKTIEELEAKMNRGKESLAGILRSTNELDSYSLVEVILSNKNLSQFFEDVDSYNSIKTSLEKQFNEIKDLQAKTEGEKKILDQKRIAEADTKAQMEEEKIRQEAAQVENRLSAGGI